MGRLNFTRLGALKLGQLVQRTLDEQEPPWKHSTLIERLGALGHDTNIWGVSRLVNGQTEKIDASLLMAIAQLEIVLNPATGKPFTLQELILIGCEAIDPIALKPPTVSNPETKLPYPAAVAEIKRGMGDRTIEQFAKAVGISKRRLNEILTSPDSSPGKALPAWEELLKLSGALYPDKSVEPLIRLYGYGSKVSSNDHSSL